MKSALIYSTALEYLYNIIRSVELTEFYIRNLKKNC